MYFPCLESSRRADLIVKPRLKPIGERSGREQHDQLLPGPVRARWTGKRSPKYNIAVYSGKLVYAAWIYSGHCWLVM